MRIKKWDELQHYRDRDPKWAKLHPRIINARAWRGSDDTQKLDMIVLILYSVLENTFGDIPDDPDDIQELTRIGHRPNLQHLVDVGFLEGERAPDPDQGQRERKRERRARDSKVEQTVPDDTGPPLPPLKPASQAVLNQVLYHWPSAPVDVAREIAVTIRRDFPHLDHAEVLKAARGKWQDQPISTLKRWVYNECTYTRRDQARDRKQNEPAPAPTRKCDRCGRVVKDWIGRVCHPCHNELETEARGDTDA